MATHEERIHSLEVWQSRLLTGGAVLGFCVLAFFSYEKWADIPKHVQEQFYHEIDPQTVKKVKDAGEAADKVLGYTKDLREIVGQRYFVFDHINDQSIDALKQWFAEDEIPRAKEFRNASGNDQRSFLIGPIKYADGKALSTMVNPTSDNFANTPEVLLSPFMVDVGYSGTPWKLELVKDKTNSASFYAKLTIWGPNSIGGFAFQWLAVGK